MLRRWLWPHRAVEQALRREELSALRQAVLTSPYLAETDLNEGFTGTSGFTLLFHREETERALALLPELKPFLEAAVKPAANVFFLNPLVLHAGGSGVAAHADKTLVSYVDSGDPPFPFCVSVLYLSLPAEKKGGNIVFHRAIGKLEKKPVENLLLEFPGWLLHEVTPLSSEPGSPPRVSLVLEQYQLSEEMKTEVPRFSLETSRPFSDFLDEVRSEAELASSRWAPSGTPAAYEFEDENDEFEAEKESVESELANEEGTLEPDEAREDA